MIANGLPPGIRQAGNEWIESGREEVPMARRRPAVRAVRAERVERVER